MKDDRGSWYILTAVVVGIGLGLLYSWIISPVKFVDTPPVSLREDYKERYRAAIAAAYQATGNLERAKDRLELLGDGDSAVILVAQAQRTLADNGSILEAQALANLAAALGQAPTPYPTQPQNTTTLAPSHTLTQTGSPSPTPEPTNTPTDTPTDVITPTSTLSSTMIVTSGPSSTPTITRTPQPSQTASTTLPPTLTWTPTATLAPPFVLDNLVEVCNPVITEPQIQVFVSNAAGVGIPGVEIIITWNGGEEHFFTGLKPDIDIGYADFVMEPEVFYVLQVAEGGQLITDLTAPQCISGEEPYWGSLRLVFSHP